ncbi:DUF881 domain-containing protein [Cellulomonas bogoriensis]|uniref:DUF881 domain-containing protein n=1 Tax=Cellulomonas bogoriensis 69B4 = DSM 16987 TaxID=1386082 RepID=A0A0A0BZN0_9CELL|nr:DUF881 domain-containing protein [Cellulomonas bogoriensis]KGM13400.1 hypothetical protein N869_14325 [Cellulomonas bogoriensis 69B4 = DSM 16987]
MSGPDRRRPGQHAAPTPDASMQILDGVMYRPVDTSPRPGRGPSTGPGRTRRAAVHLALALALGLLTAVAVGSLRAPQPAATEGHNLLQEQIVDRTELVEALRAETAVLAAEIRELQNEALGAGDPALVEALEQIELISGAVAVQGDGVVVELDDAPPADGRSSPASRVQDIDLQIVTNALWAAGAEAVAINGQRLTSVSAIRGAGEAILVDLQPLIAPYRVEAIGDPRRMQPAFGRSAAPSHLSTLSNTYGITSSVRSGRDLVLPGAGTSELRHARIPLDDDGVTSSEADERTS